jgi:hypothetical protein
MSLRERTCVIMRALVLLCFLLLPDLTQADEPTITVTVGNETRSFTRGEFLARPDATTIEVARDVTYRVSITYRAVPIASLLAEMTLPPDSVIEAVALDGFIAQLPPDLVLNSEESKVVCLRPSSALRNPLRPMVRGASFYDGGRGEEARIAGFQHINNAWRPRPGLVRRVSPILCTKACRGPLHLSA